MRFPGIVQPVWFTPTQIGRVGHRLLAAVRPRALPHEGVYAIQTQADYDAWLKEEAEYLANP